MAIAVKYKGDGSEFVYQVPARDITDDEFAAMPDHVKARIAEYSNLYELSGRDVPKDVRAAARRVAREDESTGTASVDTSNDAGSH
jgi:hypothetical protein